MGYLDDLVGIGTAVLNELDVDDGKLAVYSSRGIKICPLGACLNRNLFQLLTATKLASDGRGNVFDVSGEMRDPERSQLDGILGSAYNAAPTLEGINQGCTGVINAVDVVSQLLAGGQRLSPNGIVLLAWNKADPDNTDIFPGWQSYRDERLNGHTFWGLSSARPSAPVRRPPPGGRRP